MNHFHRWFCRSAFWRAGLRKHILPWALEGVALGDSVLEIGPGPGMATDFLLRRLPRLTAIELDPLLAAALRARTRDTSLSVVRGDGTNLPFPNASFSGVVCFTMLHHIPTPQAQDRLLHEVRRVLRPGGSFAGTDSRHRSGLKLMHYHDTYVPVEPGAFASRLRQAGFTQTSVDAQPRVFRFRAR